ncbi:MAG: hypothetical protein A3K19_14760 [Lentisphaerae bacterium RIFOXYB12_FULL_65_16]|nr:MAG: hypothetical protein A3K18_14405 [Lentisphaerae bacterium RIFOXYA12_64_32]OGV87836.1 MAG: hypothetical protein A3K19_14760 [Lentisphaerae bacterium RIFOXYB12_FULL_65_16]
MKARVAILCLLLWAAGAAAAAPTLQVVEHIWGFDGKAVPGRFVPLSVLIVNPGVAPFEGVLSLTKGTGPVSRQGAEYIQPCFLSPGTSRWVQFYPFIGDEWGDWSVSWGTRADAQFALKRPEMGPPATVHLVDPEAVLRRDLKLKTFPESLFPTCGAGAEALHALALDHVPRWDEARRRACRDWLLAGGTVHLIAGPDGNAPRFTSELDCLNTPLDQFHVGAGTVLRHGRPVDAALEEVQHQIQARAATLTRGKKILLHRVEDYLVPALNRLVLPAHNWNLIELLTAVYALLVTLVSFLLFRKAKGHWLPLGGLLVLVVAFSAAFAQVGRQGYGERGSMYSLTYARALDAGRYDVTQWLTAFVTRGAQYALAHSATHNLYASTQDYEGANAAICSGKDGKALADIPVFSKQSFLHRGAMPGPDLGLQVITSKGEDTLEALTLAPGPAFPPAPVEMWVVHRRNVYPLARTLDGRLEASMPAWGTVDQLVNNDSLYKDQFVRQTGNWREEGPSDATVQKALRRLIGLLMARSQGGTESFTWCFSNEAAAMAPDRFQVFVFARSPESFGATGGVFGREQGYTLYHADLWR